jgi:hypothetical protein
MYGEVAGMKHREAGRSLIKQGLNGGSDTGTVWVARPSARIGVIGGKGKGVDTGTG